MISLEQRISLEDYKAAARVHYRTYRYGRFRPWLAWILILIGIVLVFFTSRNLLGSLCVAYGLFVVLSKKLWVSRLANTAAKAKHFGEVIHVQIDDQKVLTAEQSGDVTRIQLSSFVGYIRHSIGFLLYPQENLFYLLKADAFDSGKQMDRLEEILSDSGVDERQI